MKAIQNPKSKIQNLPSPSILQDATTYLVGGVNSPVRAFRHVSADPMALATGRGAVVTDADGERYVDYIMGWGTLILGHRHPAVVSALREMLGRGMPIGLTTRAEVELAQLIAEAVPSIEQVRFTTSGTEACMTAVKLARAVTGRSKLLLFDGCYHGHGDSVMAGKTPGLPGSVAAETVTVPFNDLRALEDAIGRHAQTLACAIVEPVAANMGVVPPAAGFLQHLRDLTRRHGILLIFDEVVTGFRLAPGGAQERFGIRPDLTALGKIIGGGLPIGALGGPARLMQRLAPEGDVYHGGTFAGHPLSMAAGAAVLRELRAHPPYARLEQLAGRLAAELEETARARAIPVRINRAGSMLTVFFSGQPVAAAAESRASRRDRFARWANGLRRRGILIPPSPFEALFLSTAHTDGHVDRFVRAAREAFAES